MRNEDVIESKLSAMKRYIALLESVLPTVVVDSLEIYAVERLFQLVVDAAIDVNTHIITRANLDTPDDYHGTFTILGDKKVIPFELAEKISESVGLRNLLVHGYEKVDKQKMLSDIKSGIGQYVEYMKHILEYVERQR